MSRYVHGTSAAEHERLGILNRLLNERELAELELTGGERLLEVGAGTGVFARAAARAVGPEGRVVAIERSAEQIAAARAIARTAGEEELVDLREGDALDPPLASGEWGSFDVAHARFLLEHLSDPLALVRVLVRAVRAGGRVVLADDHELLRIWPAVEGWDELWRLYYEQYRALGNDPLVGRKLVELLAAAGARPVRNTYLFFGACAGDARFADAIANLIGVVRGAREVVLAAGAITGAELDARLERVERWSERSDAALWYGISWAEGRKEPLNTTSC